MSADVKVVKPKLDLRNVDGNAFAIMGVARRAAQANKMDWPSIQKEMMSGDYDNLLNVCMKLCECCLAILCPVFSKGQHAFSF